ncbi:TPA: ABC transporter ATP-binding protein [Photobacterium damselae]
MAILLTCHSLTYPNASTATLSNVSLQLQAKQWTCLLGKSGSGKSTLLRLLANLLPDDVQFIGNIQTEHDENIHQHIAYMAQQDLLLPWLNVIDNVCLSYQFGSQKCQSEYKSCNAKKSVYQQAMTLLDKVGLRHYAEHMPQQLSGGMKQRVALARTLMQDKPIVLMDEPFSALDAVTRYKLQNLAVELLREKAVVLITHDPQEALRLGEQIIMLTGTPASLRQLNIPNSPIPRQLDSEFAQYQQEILSNLEAEYV